MSIKHAILGFLSFKPLSGYGLKKTFDRSVQHFWPANQSQIYRTLAQMNDQGLVEQEVIEREDRLNKKLYHITSTGREELHTWLTTPLSAPDYREPFLIQLYFGGLISDDELIHILRHEIQDLEQRIATFYAAYQGYQQMMATHENPRAFFLSVLTMEFGLNNSLASLAWLKSVLTRVQSGDYTFLDFQLDEFGEK
jgi:DNA-binding PadR family transcriptional regulator